MLTVQTGADRGWISELDDALPVANIPTLVMILVHLTGDDKWLSERYKCSRIRGIDDNDSGGLPQEVQIEVRQAARQAIIAWKNGNASKLPVPDESVLVAMLQQSVGEDVSDAYGPMISSWFQSDTAVSSEARTPGNLREGYRVLIIGAGVAGMCAAIRLKAEGIPHTIIEKNGEVGGTWYENTYPSAGVDTPSHIYSFSFAKHDWSKYFALREEIQDYFVRVADDFKIRDNIRFNTSCDQLAYDEENCRWNAQITGADGKTEMLTADVVISAVGILNVPKYPSIPGLESFQGDCFHTARWPEGFSIEGKRVGIIGNGASAMQVVPAIADKVKKLTIFQRSKQWAAPFERFHKNIPDTIRFLLREVPFYQEWYRQRLAWVFNDRIHSSLQIDPEWPQPERAINRQNDKHRQHFENYIKEELGGREDLLDAVLPDYPPFGKRMLMDNGWYRTMTKDNVELVNSHISQVNGSCVETQDGVSHELDVLIIATGFDAVNFLSSIEVFGRGGKRLRDGWDKDGAEAYLGMTVPDFPNMLVMAGPNTALGHGGSVVASLEIQANYILTLIQKAVEAADSAPLEFEVRRDVHDVFNQRVQEAHNKMIWSHKGMSNWYRNSQGKIVAPTPFRNDDYWHMLRLQNLDDFNVRVGDLLSAEPAMSEAER